MADQEQREGEEVLKAYKPKSRQVPQSPEPDVQVWMPGATPQKPRQTPEDAFFAQWAPEYGALAQPTRLEELKQQLQAGPEKLYQSLQKKGILGLQMAVFLSFLLVVMAVASVALHWLDMVQPERMQLLVLGELVAMLLSALLCWERLTEGLFALFRLEFRMDSLLLCSFTACLADGIFCLPQTQVPFCAAFCVECMMCLWAEYQRRITVLDQTDVLRKATRLERVVRVPDCMDGKAGFHVCQGQVEDYMRRREEPTPPGQALDRYALIAAVFSAAAALWAGIQQDPQAGVRTWAATILAAAPATIFLCQSRPLAIVQRRLRKVGAVLCSWQGLQAARGDALVPMTDRSLFPRNGLKINGMKFYSDRSPDFLLGHATAVICASGDCTAPVFEQLLKSRHAQCYEVEHFKRYGDQGMGGLVGGQQVLLGSREFLREMGISVDPGAKVPHAVYMAMDGVFAAVFALSWTRLKGVRSGIRALCSQQGLTPVVATRNFLLTREFLEQKFRIDPKTVSFPSVIRRERLAGWKPDCTGVIPCALVTQEGLGGIALAITGARNLYRASILGAAAHIGAGLLGLAAALSLTLLGHMEWMTPANLLLLELLWCIPGLLISEMPRKY